MFLIIFYHFNKNKNFSLPSFKFNNFEKIFLIFALQFPFLSIWGASVGSLQNGNNIILTLFLLLIPIYVIFVSYFHKKLNNKFYLISLILITISLLFMFMFRFSHIYGNDANLEYNYFQMTLNNLRWNVFGNTPLTSSLGISLLPAIFAVLSKFTSQEYLFKFIFVSICSLTPLVVYSIAKKYTNNFNSFLASFFLSQITFISTAGSARTNLAVFLP